MAISINVRLSDEIEQKLKNTVNDIKKKTPTGAEVNNSTIVRGALEDFFKKIENNKRGIKNTSYDLSKISSREDALKLIELIDSIIKELGETEKYDNNKTLIWEVLTNIQSNALEVALSLNKILKK